MGKSLSLLKPYRSKVVFAPSMKAFECVFELATPFLVRYIIDVGMGESDPLVAYGLSALILLLSVVGFFTTMVTQYLASRVSADFGYDLRRSLFDHVSELGERELSLYGKDRAMNLFGSDAQNLQTGVAMFMRLFVRSPLIILGSLVLSFVISWEAGLIFLTALGLSSIVLLAVVFVSPKRYAKVQEGLDRMALYSGDALSGIRSVRAYEKTGRESGKYASAAEDYKKRNISLGNLNSLVNPISFALIYLALALVVYLGGLYQSEGLLTTGEIVSLVGYLTASLTSLTMFSRLINSLNKAGGSLKRLDAFFALKPSFLSSGSLRGQGEDALAFEKVSFSYGGEDALSDIGFVLPKGGSLGIIGGTGSGKSTIAYLSSRLLLPREGKISLFGIDIRDYGEKELREDVRFIMQKPSIFQGSIRENLCLGGDYGDEELIEALKKSLAYEFVSEYKDGLDHVVKESGADLSGGQRQRLALARAFLGHPRLVILDDCLSALDYLSEKRVRENLSSMEGTATLTISQRTSSLSHADEILVLKEGRVVGRGKHVELLQNCPLYREIDQTQKEAR